MISEDHYAQLLNDVHRLREAIDNLGHRIDDTEQEIKSEMKLNHQEHGYQYKDHERRLTFQEKLTFGAVGTIMLAVIGAIMTLVLKK